MHVNIYGYVEPRSQHVALCSSLIMVRHPDNTIPHLQDYINLQVRIVQDSTSVSLFMVMSRYRNAFLINSDFVKGIHRWFEMPQTSCNGLIKHILTHYNPQFSYAWRKSRIMVWHGSSICPSVLPSIDIWLSTGVTTCPINFNFIDIFHLVHPQGSGYWALQWSQNFTFSDRLACFF